MDRYEKGRQVITHLGGKLPIYSALVSAVLKADGLDHARATAKRIDASEKRSIECQMVMGFIFGFDRVRFGKLIEDLENQHTKGIKCFPQTLIEAFALLNNWKNNPKNRKLILGDGVAFINKGGKGSTKDKSQVKKDHTTGFKYN